MKVTVKVGDQTYEVEIESIQARPVVAIVDGERFEVWPEDAASKPAPTQGQPLPPVIPAARPVSLPAAPSSGGAVDAYKAVTAPIPGTILEVNVHPGDKVAFGQDLLVLEAMKMKNVIKAVRAGTVGVVHVVCGDRVRHGQLLLEYTD
jgi:biotin carboxyl carrier protein